MKGNGTPQEIKEYTAKYRRKKKWLTIVTCLAAVVVFCTTYALILPAIALEKDSPQCGKEEHSHSEACYTQALVCGQEESGGHTHSSECYGEPELTCGMEEHTHEDSCYAGTGDGGQSDRQPASGTDDGIALAAESEEAVWNTLNAQGIYKGTKSTVEGKETWTVYDAATKDAAEVQAVVTLPEGVKSSGEEYYLYIRPVAADEGYYPSEAALQTMAGQINEGGIQCYAIHWVRVYQENGQWTYDLETDSVLQGNPTATVEIKYLSEDACLKGHRANRKLQVYNSRKADGSDLEDASQPTAVTANEDAYTGFTFTTNRGGPYVFVSKYLYEGYVKSITIDNMIDGTAPFDSDDEAGNDSGENNHIVRSYDAIQYNLTANFGARSSVSTTKTGELGFEMTMEADVTEAYFDTSKMLWLKGNYTIEYLDEAGQVVLTQKPDGTYVNAKNEAVSLNDIVSDSTKGEDSYSSGIVCQRLRGQVTVEADQNLLAGNQTFSAAIQVLGSDNGKEIQPTFRAWFVGNEDNYGSENAGEGMDVTLAEKVTDNKKEAEAVTVSAAARFNLELAKNTNMTYKSWFDSSKGTEVSKAADYTIGNTIVTGKDLYTLLEKLSELEENRGKSNPQEFTDKDGVCSEYLKDLPLAEYQQAFRNIRYGRITGYGITLQVYNEATGDQNTASKGFKGISLPQGAVTFDLELDNDIKVLVGTADEDQYYAELWEYNENVNEEKGNQKKNMYWADLASTKYASWAAPYNSGNPENVSYCYNGGNWEKDGSGKYSFTVSGYDFNFLASGLKFPTHRAGNGSAETGYNTYIGSYSAGYVQVLNVIPRYQEGTLSMFTTVTVKDLALTTTDGTKISTAEGDETGYGHETNTKDNTLKDEIPLYKKGGMTKANAFDRVELYAEDNGDFTSKNYFLGTDFWNTGYDSSAFAGQEITLVGAFRIGAGDYQIRHANVLQLFDSGALSLISDKKPKVESRVTGAVVGDTNILYAADPDYPEGYDTGKEEVMHYMSEVREEDLIYYESLEKLQEAGFTCVGVMAELRNWTINGEGGYATSLKIPMTVSQNEKYLGETVGTVNTVRIWTNAEAMEHGTVSWADGENNPEKDKNCVKGYTPMDSSSDENFCGEVANSDGYYDKTEYEKGQIIFGSNTGGYVYGSSLLILNYKSEVDIEVDNKEGAQPSYNLDQGENTVNYRVKDIIAKTEDNIGSPQNTTTNLTILTKLDTPRDGGDNTQRIAVSADSYHMEPASNKMVLTDADGVVLEEQSVKISSDKAHPTTVYYALLNDKGEIEQRYEIQVYAQRDTNGTQVTFEVSNATVDISLPDITFDALIDPEQVKNNDTIQSSAYISGTSDVRAYSETNGNMDTVGIGIIQLGGTRLIKAVDQQYIEQDGVFKYTVTYTNRGQEPTGLYLYDLLPDSDDIRGSEYEGEAILRKVAANLSGEGGFTATIRFYYSKTAYTELYDKVRVFGGNEDGTGKSVANIEAMLGNSRWFSPLGTISAANNHQFQISDNLAGMSGEALTEEMRQMTGIYAVVENLGGGKSLTIELTMESDGNESGDLYRNIANSWLGGGDEPLTSNLVETSVLSRAISGVIWDDADFDGVRDEGESLISGVDCTLFKLDEDKESPTYGEYVLCEKDVTGAELTPVTTKADGAYSFEKLAAGQYIVAFSGEGLEGTGNQKYVGATTYQVNKENDSTTNDAVALTATKGKLDTDNVKIDGIDSTTYRYAIAYSFDSEKQTVGAAPLHTIEEILEGNLLLTNGVELHANLDCGLVIASYELPKTGGAGTTLYTIGGLLIISISLLLLYRKKYQDLKS